MIKFTEVIYRSNGVLELWKSTGEGSGWTITTDPVLGNWVVHETTMYGMDTRFHECFTDMVVAMEYVEKCIREYT